MAVYHRSVQLLLIQLFLLLIVMPMRVDADSGDENPLIGRKFNTYIYATYADESSTTISFEENMVLLIDIYDGFGLYLPIANLFIANYWAPDYYNRKDLFLILNGTAVLDFIAGGGIDLRDYQYYGVFLFFGYAE